MDINSIIAGADIPKLLVDKNSSEINNIAEWARHREYIMETILSEEYGVFPPPCGLEQKSQEMRPDYAGKATLTKYIIALNTPRGMFDLPYELLLPANNNSCKVFLYISFNGSILSSPLPAEEIIDRGYGIASVCYNDITMDNGDMEDGLAGMFAPAYKESNHWGKIAMWAWGASRVMDHLLTLNNIEPGKIAVAGHSRLGKTALLCGAFDQRFGAVISNNSGCSGAAVSRVKSGEKISDITAIFPYWFCDNYKKYANNENRQSLDQHHLLALIAPRLLYVSSAIDDAWADPHAEWLGAALASDAWRIMGLAGLENCETFPKPSQPDTNGQVGYHVRSGRHFISRTDWNFFMDFLDKKWR